ncbi:substrate-binding domain-containing protein [Marinobacterium weihaiense]|uniref:Substrate-binding domain-containing protein n=1 Tax=Marinobacterium weihaiense TaxID=2851016 RepID=A0ABS6M6Y1_9GAMM|nr:substrate-binding domain-containing protein [Marinobacterium weihaiense]MBV0932048.1 substrate-binding domain-containing protein [Marinobacterium weihaiense]
MLTFKQGGDVGQNQRVCLLALMLLAMMASVSQAASLDDYWLYEQYYEDHPEELPWLEALTRAVQSPPRSIHSGEQHRPVRIAQVYPGLQASSYWSDSENALTGRLDDLGIRYWLETRYTAPNIHLDEQIRQIRELLEWQPDFLIYTLDSPRHRHIIERLIQNTDTRLILQNITTPLKSWKNRQPFMYVGFDHIEGGRILARHFAERFPEGARYGVLFRSKGLVSQMRGSGFIEALPPGHRMLSSYYSDSSRDGGREAAGRMLSQHPELDYIYACSTDVALGTLDALEASGQSLSVNGWGGGPEEIEQLREGRLDTVLMRLGDEAGIAIAEAISRTLQGKPVPTVFSGQFVVLDSRMSDAEIHQHEAYARRYSGAGRDY